MKSAMPCALTDQLGKVFVAEAFGMRRCLVCDQGFTREEAPKHAETTCYPKLKVPAQPNAKEYLSK